jgi:hypothetical protein
MEPMLLSWSNALRMRLAVRPRDLYRSGLTVSVAATMALSCSSGTGHGATATSTTTTSRAISSPPSTVPLALSCSDAIHSAPAPYVGMSVVLGVVALPTHRTLQTGRSGESGNRRLFAKIGLLARSGSAPFELIVPPGLVGHLFLGWGNPATPTSDLRVSGCRSSVPNQPWVAFAGGYWVGSPACVPVTVRTGGSEQTVHIGVGKACLGQQPPPQPSDT